MSGLWIKVSSRLCDNEQGKNGKKSWTGIKAIAPKKLFEKTQYVNSNITEFCMLSSVLLCEIIWGNFKWTVN